MTDTLAPRNTQLAVTQQVLDRALSDHGFDFGVFISVQVAADGRCKVECALSGDGPSDLARTMGGVLRRLAVEVETGMREQAKEWLRSMS
jgi:hypothetical protein